MIRIEIDNRSGFCTGVINAVKKAEEHLYDNSTLFSLGELVHNPEEVKRLGEMGLKPISYEEYDGLQNSIALIRAHGEPPETFNRAEAQNITLIDATCSIVRKLQDQIRDCFSDLIKGKGSIIIFGKSSHPEVRALVGQTDGKAIVLRNPGELSAIELKSPVSLFSQTTMNLEEFDQFTDSLQEHMIDAGMDPEKNLHVHNTVCKQVSSRENYLKEFVDRYDLVFFVSGKQSSNGKALFGICRQVNENTYFVSNPSETDGIDLKKISTIGTEI